MPEVVKIDKVMATGIIKAVVVLKKKRNLFRIGIIKIYYNNETNSII